MKPFTLRSPAKLNLYLKVLNKRPDGYHNLKTLFERIDLCDDLAFAVNSTGTVRILCDHPQVPTGRKNLIVQAGETLKQAAGHRQWGADIRVIKRIPVAAGLAGGSSNAATALLGLNRLWKIGLKTDDLIRFGGELGADVPFFLHQCSWGLGNERGDRISRLDLPAKLWHVLVVPRIKMYSREVFTSLNLQLTKAPDNVNILIRSLKYNNIIEVEKLLANDLESSILKIRPQLENVKKLLRACHLRGVSFSGSGPTVFGLTPSRKEARHIQTILCRRYKQVFIARTL